MPPHALELPEVLTLVGSFLPIWVVNYPGNQDHLLFHFKPASLCRCLRVSKLWYDTLLPILWYGYWTENKAMVDIMPLEAISRHCHLLKVLQVHSYDAYRLQSVLLGCINLVDLSIFVNNNREINGQTGELPEGQLLRSNPLLKRLHWIGSTVDDPRLNPQDFVGLRNLESLTLVYWDCSGGRLVGVLGAMSGTLKELSIGVNSGLQPGVFSLALLQDDKGCHGKDAGTVIAGPTVLRLERLETLSWGYDDTALDCAAELVKCCPNLKTFRLTLQKPAYFVGLADNLRIHCPHLEKVKIWLFSESDSFEIFFRRCSKASLRAVDIGSRKARDDLLLGALHHASTLEDLRLYWGSESKVGPIYLRLPVECTQLKRFAFHASFHSFETNPLEALRQEKWGCRGLEELDLHLGFLVTYMPFTEESEQEFRDMAFAAGWEMVPLSHRCHMFDVTYLPKVFELLVFQELDRLQTLVLEGIPFRRIAQAKRLE